jgi:O-antigen/teichoic acid export membrane protein
VSLRKSASWLGAAQLIGLVLQFSTSVVFARYLSPHEMGIYAIAVALVGLLSVIQQLSLPALIIREENMTEDFAHTAFTMNAAITMIFALVIVAAALSGLAGSSDPGVRHVLLVLAISPLFGILSFLPMAQLEREGRFKALALISAAAIIVNAVVGIVLVVQGVGYMSIAYAQLAYSAVFTGLALYIGRHHARFRFGRQAWRRVLRFSMQTLAISGMHTAGGRITELLIGRMISLSALGLFNRASGLNSLVWQNFANIVSRVVLVDFAEIHRQQLSLRDRYLRTVAVMTAILWPAFAGLAVIARPFIIWVYGERWEAAVMPLVYLAISSIILTSISMTWELFTATGRMREQTRVETIRVVVGTGLFAIGCFYGLEGAAASRVVDAVLAIFIYRPYLNSMTGTTARDFLPIYLRSGLAMVLAILPASALVAFYGVALPPLPLMGGAMLLGGGAWLACLAMLDHPAWQEVQKAAGPLLGRLRRKAAR